MLRDVFCRAAVERGIVNTKYQAEDFLKIRKYPYDADLTEKDFEELWRWRNFYVAEHTDGIVYLFRDIRCTSYDALWNYNHEER